MQCALPARSCTLWAAAGARLADGGTVLGKNRDQKPTQQTQFELIRPKKGFAYLGMMGGKPGKLSPRGGINQKGLAVVMATAGSLPGEIRHKGKKGLARHILEKYSGVDEVLADKQQLAKFHPVFLLLADREKIAAMEISTMGVSVEISTTGTLAHTNHYSLAAGLRQTPSGSSLARLNRIRELLAARQSITLEDSISFGRDQSAGPDDSIRRIGSNGKVARTIASVSIRIPKSGPPEIYAGLTNADRAPKEKRFKLDKAFWEGETFLFR